VEVRRDEWNNSGPGRYVLTDAFRDGSQRFISSLFLVEREAQQSRDIIEREQFRRGTGAAISGDLVVLDLLGGRN
jgi:hypothetical protein